jgi:hypothetical protein
MTNEETQQPSTKNANDNQIPYHYAYFGCCNRTILTRADIVQPTYCPFCGRAELEKSSIGISVNYSDKRVNKALAATAPKPEPPPQAGNWHVFGTHSNELGGPPQASGAAWVLAEKLATEAFEKDKESGGEWFSIHKAIPIIQAAFDRVRAETKEEDAKIAERTPFRAHAESDVDFHSGCVQTRERIAAAIRASKGA